MSNILLVGNEIGRSNSQTRNPEGIWINSNYFREEALHYLKHGFYCGDPWGSPRWLEYWTEQQRRCLEGYTVAGVTITGHHYGYLNFGQIKVLADPSEEGKRNAKKVVTFPDFWDGDYNYFWSLEIARNGITPEGLKGLQLMTNPHPDYLNGGYHMIVGKARRKGYSYKNGFICANVYNTMRDAQCLIGAFDKKYLFPNGTMGMANNYLNFFNDKTGWKKRRDYVDKTEHKKASFKEFENGVPIEKGYRSEIQAISFKDNPEAARGKDPYLMLFEEAGAFPNLLDSYSATEPALRAGKYITGQIVIFGTGGDMESGTVDFAEMFYNPALYNLMPFENIWDEDAEGTRCGFFHPMQWNREGYYDADGNSQVNEALKDEAILREQMARESSAGSMAIQKRVQEHPTCPAEAFLTVSTNTFPVIELQRRLNKLKREHLYEKMGQPVELYYEDGVKARVDLEGKLQPIWFRKSKHKDRTGAVVIYEYPQQLERGAYKIGFDPYAQDDGTSDCSIWVYKSATKDSFTSDQIVAEYYGRPGDVDSATQIFEMLCELYNSPGMYENMVIHVKSYMARRGKLHLLATQPDQVISKAVKESGVGRVYGIHMTEEIKDAGEKYIKQWLLTERGADEEGRVLTNIDFIYSPGLLEELIAYNRKKGNFDRVMAFMMVLMQKEEERLGQEYETVTNNTDTLFDLMGRLYKRN